jgi:hypothetical protein
MLFRLRTQFVLGPRLESSIGYNCGLQLLPGHTVYKTKSIFSVVREDDSVFARELRRMTEKMS